MSTDDDRTAEEIEADRMEELADWAEEARKDDIREAEVESKSRLFRLAVQRGVKS